MDEKKDKKDKKDKKPAAPGHPVKEGIMIVLFALILLAVLSQVLGVFKSPNFSSFANFNSYMEGLTGGQNGWYANAEYFFQLIVSLYIKVATVFSIVLFLVILYVVWLTSRVAAAEAKKDKEAVAPKEILSEQTQKWQMVLSHANSQNPAEWRLSILEADVMLDDLIESLGYRGESLGEKLKTINQGDFKTIDAAWEAHKVRNAIAHEGADYMITQHEARRVIELYGQVFKEFNYV